MASRILAKGRGCSPDIALRFFNAVASARILYAVPACRATIRTVGRTRWTLSTVVVYAACMACRARRRSVPPWRRLARRPSHFGREASALRHIHRMYLTSEGRRLAGRLLVRPRSCVGQRALEYAALVPDPPYCGFIPIPPHQDPGLEIKTIIPGIRSEKHTPWSALHQEAVATIEQRLAGRVLLYTDGCHSGRRFRFTNSGSPSCAECPAEETTKHILLHCPGYTEQRRRLFDAYGRLGLPHVSLDHLRFPQAHRSRLMRAFEALLEFFGDAALIARL
ncbi:hypothetical protein MRX96_003615 [Rhipicephalus microplus]